MAEADIALIGLAVMGQNIILNMNDHGFVVCAYNRTVSKVHDFLANEAKGTKIIGAESLEDMVAKLKKPRRIAMLVKAGQAVDDFIDKLVPLLEAGDIIIDGGNSEYRHDMLPANLLQAQRDYFGAHTYELLSNPGKYIHTNWTGHGGNVSSSSYNA
uniref:6-phosphogluconate dehydrogenase, decarboxylating n=1 Tax=Salmo salar TaxID=8030 RepID=B5X5G6_SALSA|nr:6-phosphogluconate dehydrogenase, decarboxylating [Salmo salar]ACI70192.1 6-phosphogluconate dehydrogenase, decarboxylating [Salmo salar]